MKARKKEKKKLMKEWDALDKNQKNLKHETKIKKEEWREEEKEMVWEMMKYKQEWNGERNKEKLGKESKTCQKSQNG